MVTKYFKVTMKPNIYDPNCPTRVVLDRIGDKWTALVVLVLLDGPLRFGHVRSAIGGVAPKVLTQTLRRLERDGIVTRRAFAEIPPRVEYELTPLGRKFMQPVRGLVTWLQSNWPTIRAARERFERRPQIRKAS